LLVCQIFKETTFCPTVHMSGSDARGLMQMTPGAIDDVNKNTPKGVHFTSGEMFDPARNIQAGSHYLQILIDRHGSVEDGLRHYGPPSEKGYAKRILACEKCL